MAVAIASSAFNVATSIDSWKVKEDQYSVKFSGTKVEGIFKGLKSEITFDATNLNVSKFTASIDATTVNTGNGMRNKHARQGLGAEMYPEISFVSNSIIKSESGFVSKGKLSINGVTKDINLPFTFTKTQDGGVFAGNFSVVPTDFKIDKKGTPELITIELNVPVTK